MTKHLTKPTREGVSSLVILGAWSIWKYRNAVNFFEVLSLACRQLFGLLKMSAKGGA